MDPKSPDSHPGALPPAYTPSLNSFLDFPNLSKITQSGGHWAEPKKKEFLVKSCLPRAPSQVRLQKAVPARADRWLCESREQSPARAGGRSHGAGLASEEPLGSAISIRHTQHLTSLPSQGPGSEGNPRRGIGSQKDRKMDQRKGWEEATRTPQTGRAGLRRRAGHHTKLQIPPLFLVLKAKQLILIKTKQL